MRNNLFQYDKPLLAPRRFTNNIYLLDVALDLTRWIACNKIRGSKPFNTELDL